ncbi:MAG TPA: PGPGW domain-containing protein [Actinomycetota bacterium]|nr:PGPGW domain-containing protein [Actinomycetota bacterium]
MAPDGGVTEAPAPGPNTEPEGSRRRLTPRRIAIGVAGFAMVLAGLILSLPLVPGPGFLLIIGGLALLATEFAWAERWLHTARTRFEAASRKAGVEPKYAAIAGILIVVVIAAIGTWFVLR